MRNQFLNVKSLMFLFGIVLLTCGTQGLSYGQAAPTVLPGDDDTSLKIEFPDEWEFGDFSEAYYVQVRKKTPQGPWGSKCNVVDLPSIPFDQILHSTLVVTIFGLEPGTTYQVRYNKDTGRRFCPGFESLISGPWSEIGEGTTSGELSSVCQVGDIIAPGESCTYPGTDYTFSISHRSFFGAPLEGGEFRGSSFTSFGTDEVKINETIQGVRVKFYARKQINGMWLIEAVEDDGTFPPPPDLVVEQPTVSQSTLAPSETFTLSATVRNQGSDRADSTTLRYYRSTDSRISPSDTEVGTDRVSRLDANESGAESISLTAPTTPGTYYYGACVDSVADESRSDNNCTAAVSITVEQPPPEPTTITLISGDNQAGLTDEPLPRPFVVRVRDQYGDPMEGVTVHFTVRAGRGSLGDTSVETDSNGLAQSLLTLGSNAGTNSVEVSVEGIAQTVTFNAVAELFEFELSVPAGISLIHVPLKVRTVNDVAQTIESIADLYDALGGTSSVNVLITYDSQAQEWRSYADARDRGTPVDKMLTDDTGVIATMKVPVEVRLTGDALGTDGSGTITISQGLNVVGLPLRDPHLTRVSDLLALDGILGNVPVIILADGGEFKSVGRAGDPGDIPLTGGSAFIMTAQQPATVTISGEAWTNTSTTAAAPSVADRGWDTTPVLALRGSIVDQHAGLNEPDFPVTVKNLSTGRAFTGKTKDEGAGYRLTFVDIETGRAATIGDTLEISAQSPNPFIGVEPLQYTVTAEDVRRSLVQLPELVAYEIPAETQLLANYPNPFNPETWIPYRLANDTDVQLYIYDINGALVRELDLGYQRAGYYTDRSCAAYWDGRNALGERIASGVYFYQLRTDSLSQMRKMVILK